MSTSELALRNSLRRDRLAEGYHEKRTLGGFDPGERDWLERDRPANGLTNDGAIRAYRETGQETDSLHAIEYEDGTTKVHVDKYHPDHYPVEHAVYDAPITTGFYVVMIALFVYYNYM